MLPKSIRLSRAGFSSLVGGTRRNSEHFSIVFKKNTPSDLSGYAIVVSKKVSPRALSRHWIKRRVRSILAKWPQPNIAIVVTARAGVENLTYEQMDNELSKALQSILG